MEGLTPPGQALAIDGGKRAALIRGLQDIAAFFAAHPSVPVPAGVTIQYSASEHSEVDRIAEEAHAGIRGHGGYYETARDFGPVTYKAIAIDGSVRIAWGEAMQVFRNAQAEAAAA